MSNLQHFAKTPATRIDSMEVYESPFQSRMSGELFQSGLRFDDYFKEITLSGVWSVLSEQLSEQATNPAPLRKSPIAFDVAMLSSLRTCV